MGDANVSYAQVCHPRSRRLSRTRQLFLLASISSPSSSLLRGTFGDPSHHKGRRVGSVWGGPDLTDTFHRGQDSPRRCPMSARKQFTPEFKREAVQL